MELWRWKKWEMVSRVRDDGGDQGNTIPGPCSYKMTPYQQRSHGNWKQVG